MYQNLLKYFNFRSLEELKTLVTGEIIRLLSPHGPKLDKRILYKMGARPKKDRVDMLLIGELREEEIEWTNYEQDRVTNFRFDRMYFLN